MKAGCSFCGAGWEFASLSGVCTSVGGQVPDGFKATEQDIDQYIAQVEASSVLGRSKRRIRLLSHLLKSEALGQGERLKAYSIGLDIFGKPSEFDPATDSVVRVEMGRLRTALTVFEAGAFADTRIHVDIPVGTYRPVIRLRSRDATISEKQSETSLPSVKPVEARETSVRMFSVLGALLFLMVGLVGLASFLGRSPSQAQSAQASAIGVQIGEITGPSNDVIRIQTALALALSRSQTIKLLESLPNGAPNPEAGFSVRVSVLTEIGMRHVSTELRDTRTGELIWIKLIKVLDGGDLEHSFDTRVARELRLRLFGASKSALSKMDPKDLPPAALFVLSTWVPGVSQSSLAWEVERIRLAREALAQDPDFGAAHSVLADKMAYLTNMRAQFDTPENQESIMRHARRALELSPFDADVIFNVGQSYWHRGNVMESTEMMGRVIELDPGHDLARFMQIVSPFTCVTAPDDVLEAAQAFDAELSSDNPIRWVTLSWVGWLHAYRGEWSKALKASEAAARIFQVPYAFMMRAMALKQLGRSAEAAQLIAEQGTNWEGFEAEHYITKTLPRLCHETKRPQAFLDLYADLANAP